jgi:hypothetical protein
MVTSVISFPESPSCLGKHLLLFLFCDRLNDVAVDVSDTAIGQRIIGIALIRHSCYCKFLLFKA